MSSLHGGPQKKGFNLPFFSEVGHLLHAVQGTHISHKPLIYTFIALNALFAIFEWQQTVYNYEFVIFISPIFLPIYLYLGAHDRLGQMSKAEALAEREWILLELRIPREVTKTPFAMETVFANLHIGSGETTWYKRYIQGGTRPSWTFEIVSLGGRLHFYVWASEGYRRLLESFLYAQYPDIEIIEAEDYSRLVDPSHHGYSMFACEYGLSDSKSNAYPIKTYIDYKMEPGDKPEESVDPLSQVLETMAAIGPGEQFWLQIIIRQTKTEKWKNLVTAEGKPYGWANVVSEAIEDIRTQTVRKVSRTDPVTGVTTETESFPNPSKGQSEGIAAIERKASKQIFDVGIRSIYLAPDEAFQGIMIPAQLQLFKPYNNQSTAGNALSVIGKWDGMFNDLPWEDIGGHHQAHLKHTAVQMYRRREYFYDPYEGPWMNLSTEELASLYHIPSSAVTTPNLQRIQSATSAAPSNLPS